MCWNEGETPMVVDTRLQADVPNASISCRSQWGNKPVLALGEPVQQAFRFQEECVVPGFKTRPIVPAKSPTANESGLNAWRGLLSSALQPHTARSRQIKLPPYSFLLMSHGLRRAWQAGASVTLLRRSGGLSTFRAQCWGLWQLGVLRSIENNLGSSWELAFACFRVPRLFPKPCTLVLRGQSP